MNIAHERRILKVSESTGNSLFLVFFCLSSVQNLPRNRKQKKNLKGFDVVFKPRSPGNTAGGNFRPRSRVSLSLLSRTEALVVVYMGIEPKPGSPSDAHAHLNR